MPHFFILLILFLSSAIGLSQPGAIKPPNLGAYIHVPKLFSQEDSVADREKSIIAHLDKFKASGLRVLLPHVNHSAGGAYFPSEVISRCEYGDWDPIAFLFKEARKRGLEVWPVIVALPCGHAQPRGILLEKPNWALRDTRGFLLGHMSPANPEVRDYVVSIIKEIVTRYQPDAFMLDYLRYPGQEVQFDPTGERAWQEASKKAAETPADQKRARQAFKEDSLTELAKQISAAARALRPGIRVAIYSWGSHVTQNHIVAQDWKTWARLGYIDQVDVSGYCYPEKDGPRYLEVFEKRLRDAVALAGDTRVDIGVAIGIHTSHGKIQRASDIEAYLKAAAPTGVRAMNVFTWEYVQPYLQEVVDKGYFTDFGNAQMPTQSNKTQSPAALPAQKLE